jgi:ketosteroid isomerase-like protein
MSDADVEVVQESFLAAGRGNPDAAAPSFDHLIEWDMSGVAGWVEKPVYRGRDEVMAFLRAWAGSWRDWRFELEEVRGARRGQVFAAIRETATGLGSGIAVDQHRYFACTLRDRRMLYVRVFSDRPAALKAVGLEA